MSDKVVQRLRDLASKLSQDQSQELNRILLEMEDDLDHGKLELKRFRDQLAQAARLAELGIMAGAVFHEMGQPLMGIKGFAELLLENLKKQGSEKLVQWATDIRDQTTRLHQMQRNVVNFLRREERPDEPVILKQSLDDCLRLFRYRASRQKVKIGLAVPDDLPAVDVSSGQLTQILVNLVGNSLDAMKSQDEGVLRLSARFDAELNIVRVLVADHGPGIPKEMRDQVFEPFFTTKLDKGTGLGLYIARTIAQANGGGLSLLKPEALEWKETPSTVFELRLPTVASPEAKAEPRPSTGDSPFPHALQALNQQLYSHADQLHVSRRLLVVDDEPVILRVLTEYMAHQEILADVATTAEEGLERLSEREYAVLLTDKNLPGISGIELLKKAKKKWPLMEVLVITGFASLDSALEAIGQGAYDYIPKPLPSFHYLGEKIRGAMARHDFEVRIKAMVDYLSQTFQAMVQSMAEEEKSSWVKRVEEALASYQEPAGAARVLIFGPKPLANTAELLGYQVTRVESMSAATAAVKEGDFQAVVFNEEEQGMLGAEAARIFQRLDPDLGVFVIARESSLNQVVSAIGVGVGDYLIRPMEGREYFGPRLSRLISRQQRVTRYRRLLETLKQVNIDLLASGNQ